MPENANKPKKRKLNQTAKRLNEATRLIMNNFKETGESIEGSSIIGCGRWKKYTSENQENAEIAVTLEDGFTVARMHDHFTCNNYKFCPTCARAGAAKMRDYITVAFVPAVQTKKLALAMMTLTASHKRDCDWKKDIADPFFEAVRIFGKNMKHDYKKIGAEGQFRAMESPVGPNGLHLHIHDELAYCPGANLEEFAASASKKWKAACKQVGLYCNDHGLHLTKDFNPCYIAKDETQKESEATAFELAAYDAKTKGHTKTLFELLDQSAKGDEQAGQDYVRACIALQGRARWNIGGLAKKLDIAAPSAWKRPAEGQAADSKPAPAMVIAYPIGDHLVATAPEQERPALAMILRAARQELRRPGSTTRMVNALCTEVVNRKIDEIKRKYAKRVAKRLDVLWSEPIHVSIKYKVKSQILKSELAFLHQAIADYEERNRMLNPVYAASQRALHAPFSVLVAPRTQEQNDFIAFVSGQELDFA